MMEDLQMYIDEMVQRFPQHKVEIEGLQQLALDEVFAGESEPNEINLCVGAIEELCLPYEEEV
jgi:hypothetical protein